jgi:predicted O-methyltransferase YrrM
MNLRHIKRWFGRVKDGFAKYAAPFAGQPITYVEVGTWIGDSALWVCENVLTHPDSQGIGIDPYEPDHKRGQEEIDRIKHAAAERLKPFSNWEWWYEKSHIALRSYGRLSIDQPIDLLYLDGQHNAHDTLLDFAYAFPHLREGSVVILDDYSIGVRQTRRDGIPRVPEAYRAILSAFALFVEPIEGGELQRALRIKRPVRVGELLTFTDYEEYRGKK